VSDNKLGVRLDREVQASSGRPSLAENACKCGLCYPAAPAVTGLSKQHQIGALGRAADRTGPQALRLTGSAACASERRQQMGV
jgi:hypothetical protein